MTTKEMETLRNGLIAAVNDAFDKLPSEAAEEKTISAEDARKVRLMKGFQICASTISTNNETECKDCPYYCSNCCDEMSQDALWLIGKMEAEIAALKEPRRLSDAVRQKARQTASNLRMQAASAGDYYAGITDRESARIIESLLNVIDGNNEGGQTHV